MYASYLTLQLPIDIEAWKGPPENMDPVRTWMLTCMIERGQQERQEALHNAQIYRVQEDPFVIEQKRDIEAAENLLKSYNQISSEIDTALKSYANEEEQFKTHNENIRKLTQGCEEYYQRLKNLDDDIDSAFHKFYYS